MSTNWALASNGTTATASATEAGSAAKTIDGVRNTANNWPASGLDTGAPLPTNVVYDFGATREIGEIDIFTVADVVNSSVDPTLADTFSLYGITAYKVEYWTGTSWTTLFTVTGNNKVWRQHTFTPIATTKLRFTATDAADHASMRLVEFEAWGIPPKEQRIIDEVVARMQLINPANAGYVANGFQTAIGVNVEDSRQSWDEDDIDAISVFQGTTTSTENSDKYDSAKTMHLMPIVIKIFLRQRDTSALTAAFVRKCISDVKRAIRIDDRWKVNEIGLAMITREKASGPEYADAQSFEITGAQVEVEVLYITDKFNAEQ